MQVKQLILMDDLQGRNFVKILGGAHFFFSMAAQILGGAHFFFLWQAQKSGGAKAPPAPLEITPLDMYIVCTIFKPLHIGY